MTEIKMKFVADSMLGKLAKWLRVLGYDTHYERFYKPGALVPFEKEGRFLLTRNESAKAFYYNIVLLHADKVKSQVDELRNELSLTPVRSNWFTRCLICNDLLKKIERDKARDHVPEYVFYKNLAGIRSCPSCKRYFWPGSHRTRMIKQLEEWGF